MLDRLTITAPAKVNLALSVGPPDAATQLHPICSWMVTVNLCDELELTRLDPGSLSRYAILWHDEALQRTEVDWSIRDDLAVRAHLALEQHVGRPLPLQAALRKRVAVGGGLGGGSSDAAAMLVGCRRLFALQDEVSDQDLRTIAAQLGSDVPFLIQGGSAIVEGFGDQIVPQEGLPDSHLVLVFTGAACPTGGIYARFDAGPEARLQPDKVRSAAAGSVPPFNDLAAPAMAHAPELAEAASKLEQLIECDVHVSGSGATLFMLCNGEVEAHAVAEAVTTKLNLPAIAVAPALRQILSETPTT